jgi:hypothetical protein
MENQIISYLEMCQREGFSLQRGMNFKINNGKSIILMSVRKNAPYKDRIEDNGTTIIYEGHDVSKSVQHKNPKEHDQPRVTSSGKLTENGKFHKAAIDYKLGHQKPERILVYEKIRQGIWSYNGEFNLIDSWIEESQGRKVFKFKLVAIEEQKTYADVRNDVIRVRRIIPTSVKIEVWKRDSGKCVKCGATDDLHFDHVIPYSKGGSSNTPDNIQLLCGRHNIKKRDKIE